VTQPAKGQAKYPHAIAFAIQVARNRWVQGLGLAMVVLVGLGLLPWPVVLAWTAVAIFSIIFENRLLRRISQDGGHSRTAQIAAPAMRLLITSLYALAAFAFLRLGGLGEYMFAFALMSASVVHVLMRHYRSPKILLLSVSPYLIVLCLVGPSVSRTALIQERPIGALTPILTVAMFAVQFWSARAQLAGAWKELTAARDAAQERAQAAQAANLTKSQFLTTMSHELRTPLHGVLGMAQALRNDALTPVQARRVGVILQQGESLLGMLNDLLDLSRIEAGALELEPIDFDLEHLVRGVAAAYEPQALRKGLDFVFEIADAAPGRYRGDAVRIRRILYRLADNAVKFTPAGRVSLLIDRIDGELVFTIRDTGIGIGEDDRGRLFEGFFQADSTLARAYDGAGIGLAICGQLTTLMGGRIEVDSRLGEGSTFTLRLPLPLIEAAPRRHVVDAAPAAHHRLSQLRVLAAEDNLINQMVLRTFLEPTGIEPIMVENGRQALDAWESQNWDLVLMDIQMPEMNGVEATKVIRSREMETGRARTPIIAVTASAMTHQLEEFAAVGMDGVVPKPVNMANLLRMIEQAVPDKAA
jgi:signal transduction histidine kinase/ActR/RegA family two-component response regulator